MRGLLVLSAGWCVFLCVWTWGYIEDDGFIHLEFARSLSRGMGFAFNGHVVYGDTSPLWALLLAAAHTLLPNWIYAAKALSIGALLFAAGGVYFFTARLQRPERLYNAALPAAMALLFVLNPFVSYWSFSGMETVAACGLTFWLTGLLCADAVSVRALLVSAALAGVAPVLRPEMVFLTAIVTPLLWHRWRSIKAGGSARIPVLLAGAALLAVPSLLWARYALRTFGALIPNTNAAKRAAPQDSVLARLLHVYAVGFPLVFPLVLLALSLVVLTYFVVIRHYLRHSRPAGQPFPEIRLPQGPALAFYLFLLWTLVAASFYIRDHTYVQTRYILVSAPGLMLSALLTLRTFSPQAGVAAYAMGLVLAVSAMARMGLPALHNKSETVSATRALALFVRDHVPPDAPVAAYAIGELAFYSDHPIVDTGGITRPGVIPFLSTSDADVFAWGKREGAQYWVFNRAPEPGSHLVFAQLAPQSTSWDLRPGIYKAQIAIELWALPSAVSPPPSIPDHAP